MNLKHSLLTVAAAAAFAVSLQAVAADEAPQIVVEEKNPITTTIKLGYESEFWVDGFNYKGYSWHTTTAGTTIHAIPKEKDIKHLTLEMGNSWNGFHLNLKGYIPVESIETKKNELTSGLDSKSTIKDWELQTYNIDLGYTYVFQNLPYIGNVSLLSAFRYTHFDKSIEEVEFGAQNPPWTPGGDTVLRNKSLPKYKYVLGVVLDEIFLSPSVMVSVNQHGKYFAKFGVRYSLPLNIISEKLTWTNTADLYYFGKNYYDWTLHQWGTLTGRTTNKAGLANLQVKSSLNYALLDHLSLNASLTMNKALQDLNQHHHCEKVLSYSSKPEFYWDLGVSYTF